MGERYFDKEPESFITTENAEKAIDDAYKRGKAEMLSVIEGIKAELNEIYDFSFGDDMIEAKFGLRTAINLIDEKLKDYTESKIST